MKARRGVQRISQYLLLVSGSRIPHRVGPPPNDTQDAIHGVRSTVDFSDALQKTSTRSSICPMLLRHQETLALGSLNQIMTYASPAVPRAASCTQINFVFGSSDVFSAAVRVFHAKKLKCEHELYCHESRTCTASAERPCYTSSV